MTVYRIAMTLALPLLLAAALWRRLRGRSPQEIAERMGRDGPDIPRGTPLLWLHGASNGEITSARWLMEALLAALPGSMILVTCNNPTARAMIEGWHEPRIRAALAPWDTPLALGRFLARRVPRALIILENELWPERIAMAHARGVPVIVLGARLSERSARRWSRLFPGTMRRMLGALSYVSAQDEGSEQRLVALGLPRNRIGPRVVLKARAAAPAAPDAPPPFPPPHPRDRILLAASTHAGEEETLLAAYAAARQAGRFALLILAPRHPGRSAEVAALVRGAGLSLATRSAGEVPGPDTAVYLADTMGEMAHWYRMAGATVIGASFVPKGGHTPFEPMAHGSALLHGPSTHNFADVFAALDAAGATPVADGAELATALGGLDATRQAELVTAAAAALPGSDDGSELVEAVARLSRLTQD